MDADSIWQATTEALATRKPQEQRAWLAYHGFNADGSPREPLSMKEIARSEGQTAMASTRLRILATDAAIHKHISRKALAESCRLKKLVDDSCDTHSIMVGDTTGIDADESGEHTRTSTSYSERRMWGWELALDRESRDTTSRQRGVGGKVDPAHDSWMRGRTLEGFHQSMLDGSRTS